MGLKRKSKYGFWKRVLILIMVLLIVGSLIDAYAKWKEKSLSDEEKLKKLLEDKTRYNKGVNRAFINEKWIYITARTFIAIALLILNIWYYYFIVNQDLSKVLNLDEALILLYSFAAFAIAGTPSNFVKLLRNTTVNLRKRWHVGKLDIDLINKKIEVLEIKMAQQTSKT